jgi:hypothetical protein
MRECFSHKHHSEIGQRTPINPLICIFGAKSSLKFVGQFSRTPAKCFGVAHIPKCVSVVKAKYVTIDLHDSCFKEDAFGF